MRELNVRELIPEIRRMLIQSCRVLPSDVKLSLKRAREEEKWPLAQAVLDDIEENYLLAEKNQVAICQDTGMALVFLEIGQDIRLLGNLEEAVNEGVAAAYTEGYLRGSVVGDPLKRVNTKNNTPAMIYQRIVPGDKIHITVAPKGFGSENMSRLKMLKPSDGIQGVRDFVLEAVREAGPNPCPPVILGVGIGGTFDKVALAAKLALLRETGKSNADPFYADLEEQLKQEINALGIGPQGMGGKAYCLAVHIEPLPTHIAGLPVAVNFNCHVARHVSEVF